MVLPFFQTLCQVFIILPSFYFLFFGKKTTINTPQSKAGEAEVVDRLIRRWRLFRSLEMSFSVVNKLSGLQRVFLSELGGSSLEVVLNGGQVVSWKNGRGEELLFVGNKNAGRSGILGGISVCFPQATSLVPFEPNEYVRTRLWSLDCSPLDHASNDRQSSVNLVLGSSDKDSKKLPCRFELRVRISISPINLTLMPSVKNISDKAFSFTFDLHNCLSISDISEVGVEGLETLGYLDNSLRKERFIEQADTLTFDGEVNLVYLNTP